MPLTGVAGDAKVVAVPRIVLAIAVFLVLQSPPVWVGTWRLNPEKSLGNSDSPYKRTTFTISPWEDGLRVAYDLVGIRGGVTHLEWNGRFDGKDYPVQGIDFVMTNAYSRVDDHTYSFVIKREGRVSGNVKVSVSADGRTMTAVTTGKNAQGQDMRTTAVYDKL